ncbi:Alpha/Beta hydrolase protein [Boletus reticuloceps]|uniref:Carboxylic ester hydrolase n=1 Tax=Boletus reticuloceps TaxID=495285 RepID=A0A8I3A7A8_9AGAM|nr:Alpha/Beta hydrolase protein [Boletus reticuloceps]
MVRMARGLSLTVLLLISSASLVNTATATNANVAAPIVDLGYARYQGQFDAQTNITSFLSIRYAAPPLDNLRFQAPQPPVPEPGIQPATQNPNTCYQTSSGASITVPVSPFGYNKRQSTTPGASEDCLFLNVFVPGTIPAEPATTGGLPVLVWIYGGGYVFDPHISTYLMSKCSYEAGYAAWYNGADLLIDSLNTVVVVVIQYRLGAFGFLAGNEVKAGGALNAGLLDQTFTLQWVQDHIGLFGGDKAHVTIWGESAGAGSVLQHIVANGGNTQPPLFHAAIVSSTYLPPQYYYNDRLPQVGHSCLVEGLRRNRHHCASSTETFTCLQSVEADMLQTANSDLAGSAFYGTFIFVPVVDGTFILERPTVTLAKGQVNGVRDHPHHISSQLTFPKQVLLAMGNQNEGNTFVDANETLTITDYVSQLFPDMTFAQVQETASVYKNYGTAVDQAIMVMGDSIFVCPTYYLLHTFAGRSWKGLFAIPPAYHAQDLLYYFNRYRLSLSLVVSSTGSLCHYLSPREHPPYNNTEFINAFSQSFISLAKYYDVNVKFDPDNITPYWNEYCVGETEMLFNRTEVGAPVVMPIRTDPELNERCAYVTFFSRVEMNDDTLRMFVCVSTSCRFWWTVTSTTAQ